MSGRPCAYRTTAPRWTELRALLALYERYGAPRSMLRSTVLLGGWRAARRLVDRIGDEARRMLDDIEGRAR